jgi:ketosteroid isomerase-like protein
MKVSYLFILLIPLVITSCFPQNKLDKMESYKNEILEIEAAFSAMAAEKGVSEAFLTYAADDAVLLRGNQLFLGKEAISNRFKELGNSADATLSWKVDFVDVSSAGDLGYTYGEYVYQYIDEKGNPIQEKGIFHTVWKRQANGEWRFVWD